MKWFVLSATGMLALFGCSTSSDLGSPPATTEEHESLTPDFHEDNCVGTMPFDAWVADQRMCVFVFANDLTHPRHPTSTGKQRYPKQFRSIYMVFPSIKLIFQ